MKLSPIENGILRELQRSFPIVERPWKVIGERVGLSEEEVLARVRELKEEKGAIRRIGAIFEGRRLGYASALVAVRVSAERIVGAAAVIGTHPGVSHSYERENEFNLWYTIAVAPGSSLSETVERLGELAAAQRSRMLPELVRYKLGVRLDTGFSDPGAREEVPEPTYPEEGQAAPLSEIEEACVRELQEDVPLEPRPFAVAAERAGVSEAELLRRVEGFRERGQLRRVAAVVRHREVGYVANAMAVWRAAEGRVDAVGRILASFQRVSHCYRRPTHADWPYELYTMIHGRSREECEAIAGMMAGEAGVEDYRLLYSGREFKKTRVRYFAPEFAEWERRLMRGEPERSREAFGSHPHLGSVAAKVRTRGEMAQVVRALKAEGRTVVFANGCFDILHAGHIRFLEGARALGDVLVVGINTDSSVRELKGPGRPLLSEEVRAGLVASLRAVDHVVLFEERTADAVLLELKPSIHAKGTDYTEETVPERETVLGFGGRVAIVGDPKDHSTRDLIKGVRERSERDSGS